MLKSYGWGGGACDFSVSPSPFGIDFGTLDFGLGLDNMCVDTLTSNFSFYDLHKISQKVNKRISCGWFVYIFRS